MKTALNIETGIIENADGSPAQSQHFNNQSFLHILPTIFDPDGAASKESLKAFSIQIDELNYSFDSVNVQLSRPLPNQSYVVIGDEHKMGIFVPISESNADTLTINLHYQFAIGNDKTITLIHQQSLKLQLPEVGLKRYSTEFNRPIPIAHECFMESSLLNDESIKSIRVDEMDKGVLVSLDSFNELPCLPGGYIHAFEYENYTPFHQKEQKITLTQFNDIHASNAKIELPYQALKDAMIMIALNTNRDKVKAVNTNAFKQLCEYWNTHADVPKDLQCAKSFQIFVRLNDEDAYQDIDLETPAFPITNLHESLKECSARIGDHFLIVFLKGYEVSEENSSIIEHLVNGDSYMNIGMTEDEYELGAWTLDALLQMNDNFSGVLRYYDNPHTLGMDLSSEEKCGVVNHFIQFINENDYSQRIFDEYARIKLKDSGCVLSELLESFRLDLFYSSGIDFITCLLGENHGSNLQYVEVLWYSHYHSSYQVDKAITDGIINPYVYNPIPPIKLSEQSIVRANLYRSILTLKDNSTILNLALKLESTFDSENFSFDVTLNNNQLFESWYEYSGKIGLEFKESLVTNIYEESLSLLDRLSTLLKTRGTQGEILIGLLQSQYTSINPYRFLEENNLLAEYKNAKKIDIEREGEFIPNEKIEKWEQHINYVDRMIVAHKQFSQYGYTPGTRPLDIN